MLFGHGCSGSQMHFNLLRRTNPTPQKHDAWRRQYFGPSKEEENVFQATQATSEGVGQTRMLRTVTPRRSQ